MPRFLRVNPTAALSVQFYRKKLHELNSAEFLYRDENQRELLRQQLLNTLLLLRIEAQTHLESGRKKALRICVAELNHCLTQLGLLELSPSTALDPGLSRQVRSESNEACPLQYMGVLIYLDLCQSKNPTISATDLLDETKEFVNQIKTLSHLTRSNAEEQIEEMKQALTLATWWRRLWWAFGKNVWLFSLSLATRTEVTTTTGINEFTPVMGCFSWLLFLLRGGIEFSEAIKESMFHETPILSGVKVENKGFWSRFGAQLSNRKFILLNDLISGVFNTTIFFGFIAPRKTDLDFIGGMLILTVLILDTLLALARYVEAKNKHDRLMKKLNDEAQILKKALSDYLDEQTLDSLWENGVVPSKAKENENIQPTWPHYVPFMGLVEKLQSLQQAQAQEVAEWRRTQIKLLNNIGLVLGLIIGYYLANACYLQGLTLMQELTLSVIGASISFLGTLLFNLVNLMVDRQQHVVGAQAYRNQADVFKHQFGLATSEAEEKHLFLQWKASMARSAHEREIATYQLKCIPIRLMIDSLPPWIFFLSLHFLVTWQAVGVIAVGIVLALAAKKIMKNWEPVEYKQKFFPELGGNKLLDKEFLREKREKSASSLALPSSPDLTVRPIDVATQVPSSKPPKVGLRKVKVD